MINVYIDLSHELWNVGWTWQWGQGALPTGVVTDNKWKFGTLVTPTDPWQYDCSSQFPFLGHIYDESSTSTTYEFKVLAQLRKAPEVHLFFAYGDPRYLESTYQNGAEYEYFDLDVLPIPDDSFDPGQIQLITGLHSTTAFRLIEAAFDGTKYFIDYGCWSNIDHLVRNTRGASYINSLDEYDYMEGTMYLWEWKYILIEIESSTYPGFFPPGILGFPPSGLGAGPGSVGVIPAEILSSMGIQSSFGIRHP